MRKGNPIKTINNKSAASVVKTIIGKQIQRSTVRNFRRHEDTAVGDGECLRVVVVVVVRSESSLFGSIPKIDESLISNRNEGISICVRLIRLLSATRGDCCCGSCCSCCLVLVNSLETVDVRVTTPSGSEDGCCTDDDTDSLALSPEALVVGDEEDCSESFIVYVSSVFVWLFSVASEVSKQERVDWWGKNPQNRILFSLIIVPIRTRCKTDL